MESFEDLILDVIRRTFIPSLLKSGVIELERIDESSLQLKIDEMQERGVRVAIEELVIRLRGPIQIP